jgi:hypothetical protein
MSRHPIRRPAANRLRQIALIASLLLAGTASAWAQGLPGTKRDLDFDAHMKSVDLDDPKFRLEYKLASAGGSSIGMFIGVGDAPTDRSFVPTNPSSIPDLPRRLLPAWAKGDGVLQGHGDQNPREHR